MKYIIFGPEFDASARLLDDVKKSDNVIYFDDPIKIKNKFLRKVMRANFDKYGFVPLKWLWKYFVEYGNPPKDDTVIFIYYGFWRVLFVRSGFVRRIRKKYPASRHVVCFWDVHLARKECDSFLKNEVDKVYLFDKTEAKKLGIDYYQLPFSRQEVGINTDIPLCDLYFVGQAKDRYNKILEIFEFCKKNGISTAFYIIGVPEEDRRYSDEIHYIDSIPYKKVLEISMRSNCGLEIQLGDVESFSNRVYEALVYGKKIISNNRSLKKYDFYDSGLIQVYDDVDKIDVNFIKEKPVNVDHDYAYDFSPLRFLEYLDNEFSKEGKRDE